MPESNDSDRLSPLVAEGDDPTTLSQALNELQSVVIMADEDRRGRADLVVEPAELARMTSLLDHPDEKVVGATI